MHALSILAIVDDDTETRIEAEYYSHGGILQYVLLNSSRTSRAHPRHCGGYVSVHDILPLESREATAEDPPNHVSSLAARESS